MMHLVLLLLLAAATVRSGACPTMCVCISNLQQNLEKPIYYESVRCQAFSENITSELPESTRDLTFTNLTENQLEIIIQSLSQDEEVKLPILDQFTITRSVVPELINLTFSYSPELRYVKLSANKIANLSSVDLEMSTLEILDLSNNAIPEITNQPFRTLHNLEMLNLSVNSLTVIDSNSFSELYKLKCLDLSYNILINLDDRLFAPLQSLQYLNLSSNQLEVLNKKCFISLLKLQQLDLSQNRLIHLELDSLELPSLARLLLTGNTKLGLSVLLVGTGQRLQTVDASQIGLKQVPAALTHSIRTLRLVGNSIQIIRCGDLDSYPLLQLLDFTSNRLELIEDDALGRLDSLRLLYLTNNTMKEIPKSLSEKLKVLHLEQNLILKIGAKDLQGLVALEVLLLNDNKIEVIEEEAFAQLSSLVTLDLSRNPLKILGCLSRSMKLQVLRLSNIRIISPAKEASFPLSATEHLITLDLSESPGLTKQLLVDTAALAAFRELQELNLSNTKLDYIRSDLFHFLPQLRFFHIQGNRINCSQLEWLAAWMRRQDDPEYKKIVCASPPELWGTLLVDLQDNEIAANYVVTTPPLFIDKETEDNNIDFNKPFAPNVKTIINETFTTDSYGEQQNKNETFNIKPSDKTEVSTNLFSVPTEKTMNNSEKYNKLNALIPEVASVTPEVDVHSNSSHGEMSMFSAEDANNQDFPGIFLLAASVAAVITLLLTLAARFVSRQRAARRLHVQEELEVTSLPGVTELW